MKRFFLFIFIFLTLEFRFSSFVFSLDPVIINKSEKAYPAGFTNDQDYIPADPDQVDTTTHVRTINITNTFSPQTTGTTNPDGSAQYTVQNIDHVDQDIELNKFTNFGLRNIFNHLTSAIKNILASPEERLKAYKNYDLNNPLGTGNFTNRGMPYRDWLCLLSRKIDEVAKFNNNQNATCIDEQVAPNVRFGKAILALNNLPLSVRQKIFLDTKAGNFYYKNCEAATLPTSLPGDIASALSKSQGNSPSDPLTLLQNNAINPMCQGSIASKVQQCDLSADGTENCKPPENISHPLGAGAIASTDVMAHAIPASHTVNNLDFGQTTKNSPIPDRPNPLSWLAAFFEQFWNDVLSDTKTFSRPTKLIYKVDKKLETGLSTDQTANTYMIPNKDARALDSANPSSTDNATLDPGYSSNMARQLWYKYATPCSWQPGCQM